MEAIVINPFLEATINLFSRMFDLKPDPGEPHLVDAFGNHRWEISGVISFLGNNTGIVVIRLPQHLADKLLDLSGMNCETEEQRHQLVAEMVGEFTNIIAGNAAGILYEKNINLAISPPIVIQGKNHRINWPDHAPIIGIPFITKYGPLTVDVSMKHIPIL